MTPLLIVLVVIQIRNFTFAIDAVSTLFSITRDPFVMLTSNIFAIAGLGPLYFIVQRVAESLRYLDEGLAAILGFAGLKLLTQNLPGIPHPAPVLSLAINASILSIVTVASLWAWWKDRKYQRESNLPAVLRRR
jgi:tellurite resistance protein TerC